MESNNNDHSNSRELQETAIDYATLVFHSELEPILIDSLHMQQENIMALSPNNNNEERRSLLQSSENNNENSNTSTQNVSYGTTDRDATAAQTTPQHSTANDDDSSENDNWVVETVPDADEDDDENDNAEVSPTTEAQNTTTTNAAAEEEEEASTTGDEQESRVSSLTRRLRCLFSTITWPIVPLGTIVALALLWVLYAASSLDLRRSCSHPLHWYALASLFLVAYIPFHAQIRSHLFSYQRERDGPIRPARVRMFDQFFHTVCLLYVYTGVTLIQTCRDDLVTGEDAKNIEGNEIAMPTDGPLNSCQATCPNLYQALSVYVATLEMFTFALILPLLFLPCIYLWFLRRATAEAEAFAQLQDRLQEEEALLSNGGVTTGDIMDSMENVKLVSRSDNTTSNNHEDNQDEVDREIWLLPYSATDASIGMKSDVKECCICMNDFPIHSQADLEDGLNSRHSSSQNDSDDSDSSESDHSAPDDVKEGSIVRTRCGHVFHKECLSGWVGGRWQMSAAARNNEDAATPDRRRRRARQTCCPLCREDLRPS